MIRPILLGLALAACGAPADDADDAVDTERATTDTDPVVATDTDTDTDTDTTVVDPTDDTGGDDSRAPFVPRDTSDTADRGPRWSSSYADTGVSPPASAGVDTTSPTWAQVLSEPGRCFVLSGSGSWIDVDVVGVQSGTVHHLARGLELPRVGGWSFGAGLAWDGRWLWAPTPRGVVRLDPLTGEFVRVYRAVFAEPRAVGFVDGDVLVPRTGGVDVYDDRAALRADVPSSSWVIASQFEAAAVGEGAAWTVSGDRLAWQVGGGPTTELALKGLSANAILSGAAASPGRFHLLDGSCDPTGCRQELSLYKLSMGGERLRAFALPSPRPRLGGLQRFGLACVYD